MERKPISITVATNVSLPDLPTPAARSLILSLLLAHRSKMLEASKGQIESSERYYFIWEAEQAEAAAHWFETFPVMGGAESHYY